MKIEYKTDRMLIVAEDERDRVFLEEVLKIRTGKIFTRVKKDSGMFGDSYEIELTEFDEEIYEQHSKHFRGSSEVSRGNTRGNAGNRAQEEPAPVSK